MNSFQIIGTISLALGISMVAFHRPIGIGFCKLGKSIFARADGTFAGDVYKNMDMARVYDETKVPRIMLWVGIVNVVDGAALWLLSKWVQLS